MAQETKSIAAETIAHHLTVLVERNIDEIMSDYTEESVLMTAEQTLRGLAEIRAFFTAAVNATPPEVMNAFKMIRQDFDGEYAYILWSAEPFVKMGSDTFHIREGKIVFQSYVATS